MRFKCHGKRCYLRVALIFLSTGLTIFFWQAPVIQSQTLAPEDIRGVWMTNYGVSGMYYSTRLDEVMANLAKHRLNTLYPAVWNRGYTLHPSPVAKQESGVKRDRLTSLPLLPFQDALKGLIYQAHRQHLRLIPWFEYGLMIPLSSTLAQHHPDWLTTTATGETVPGGTSTPPTNPFLKPLWNLQQEATGANQGWLNPFHPEVQQFLVTLIADVVKRYPVDGIQLDDHFGLPIAFGYDPYTEQLYRQEHQGNPPPQNPADSEWMGWRGEKITQLMGQIVKAVKEINPEAIISLSPNAPDFAYRKYLQNWLRWVDLGLLDEVIVQVYRQDLASLKAELYNPKIQRVNQIIPVGIGLYTGPVGKAKLIPKIQQESEAVQQAGYQGISFFCWETTLGWFKGGSREHVYDLFMELFDP